MSFRSLISAAELAAHLDDPNWIVVDCRFSLADPGAGRRMYAEAHLPGARFADLDDDLSSSITPTSGRHPLPDPDAFRNRLGEWGIDSSVQVVAYDDSGGALAARMWWLLRWMGHRAVAILDGGYSAWTSAGLTTTAEVPTPARREFTGKPDSSLWLTTDELARALDANEVLLIDAREVERFRGETEPIDPVAGHVPGAINLPFAENIGNDRRFCSPEELRRRFTAVIGDRGSIVSMCGSGVTACHNLLALEIAGFPDARLYAGSWSEWIRDPARGVATE
ncbi:MAG: sulfurtransferase [Aeoliella sp.]